MKLEEVASLLNGEIFGDHDIKITGASGIQDAKEGDITFVSAKKYVKDLDYARKEKFFRKNFMEYRIKVLLFKNANN